jgi:hypothetical protein
VRRESKGEVGGRGFGDNNLNEPRNLGMHLEERPGGNRTTIDGRYALPPMTKEDGSERRCLFRLVDHVDARRDDGIRNP